MSKIQQISFAVFSVIIVRHADWLVLYESNRTGQANSMSYSHRFLPIAEKLISF
ncbi:MAG: hypothetical protein AAB116_17765 [Candidatus Poribacteria bacterium]